MTPAASGAFAPARTVQARTSFGPAVKKLMQAEQPVRLADERVEAGLGRAPPPRGTRRGSAGSSSAISASIFAQMATGC